MSVVITDGLNPGALESLKAGLGSALVVHKAVSADTLVATLKDAEVVVIRSATKMTGDVIKACPKLKMIVRAGEGLDNVDVETAKALNIEVRNTPGANNLSVAELALGLMFACARHIGRSTVGMKQGKWEKAELTGIELSGRVLGVIGMGKIGTLTAERAAMLGMKVKFYDPFCKSTKFECATDLAELLKTSDFVSIHVPKIKETTNLLNASMIAHMKKGSVLINCSRGGIVDEAALLAALNSGQVRAAGLDVFSVEPVPAGNALVEHPQVVCTPHIGAATVEASERVGIMAAEIVLQYWKTHR